MSIRRFVFLELSLMLATVLAVAQTSAQVSDPATELESLVVTASRTAIEAQKVGSSMTVIDRETLVAGQHALVSDALRDVPGVAVSRSGGLGGVTQARIRGAEGNHTLVLIDGIEANNPVSNSEFDFANLLVADIERIEILRGPQSALYGSDAVGGVINIITRQRSPGFDSALHVEGGSLGTSEVGIEMGGGSDRYTGGFAVTRLSSTGENASRTGSETDGFENELLSLHGRADLGEALTLKANFRYIDSEQHFDSEDFAFPATPTQGLLIDSARWGSLEQSFLRLQADLDRERVQHRFGFSGTQTENRFFDAELPTGANEGEKTKLDYQLTLDLAQAADSGTDRSLTVALERELSDYANRGAGPTAAENQIQSDQQSSLVAEYRASFDRADFSASARHDRNNLFDDASTYRLTGRFTFNERARLHTSFGTGIANPGFFELFGFFPGSFIGNPELKPEKSTNFDVGIERRFDDGRIVLDLTYFRADLSDEIQTTFDFATFLASVINLDGDSERRGAELSLVADFSDRWSLRASYTYLDAEQPDGFAEVRRARHIASLDNTIRFAGGRGRLHIGVDYNGEQADNEFVFATPEDRVVLPSFTLLKLAADYRLSDKLRVYGRIENLLDEEYEEVFSYRARGRSVITGIEVAVAR